MIKLGPELTFESGGGRSRLNDFFEGIILEGLEKRLKDDKKDEKKKGKSVLDECNWIGILLLMAIPVGYLELRLLDMFRHALNLN